MQARKVYQIYASLKTEERKKFGLFLESAFFGHSTRLEDFRKLLELMVAGQTSPDLEAEVVWDLLPNTSTKFRANGFDKLCSELLAALNDFLALVEFQAHPATLGSYQIKAYVERHLDDYLPNLHDSILEKLGNELEKDAQGLHARLQIEQGMGEFVFRQPRTPHGNLLLEIDARLNVYYIAKKLEMAALVDIYNRSYSAALVLPYTEMIAEMLQNPNEVFPPLVYLHSIAWMLTKSRMDQYYWQLKELLMHEHLEIGWDQKRSFFHFLLNHCASRINEGVPAFEIEMDNLQMKMLALGIFLVEGKMPPAQFKNIITVALLNERIQWVESFIQDWGMQLSNDHEGFAQIYNKAVLAFYKGEFDGCIRQMEQVLRDFKEDVFYGLDARIYILMALFEKGEAEDVGLQLESGLNAFRLYLRREKRIGDARKTRYANLVKQLRRLISLRLELPEKRPEKAEKFIKVINNLQPASNRKWFIKQVKLLKA